MSRILFHSGRPPRLAAALMTLAVLGGSAIAEVKVSNVRASQRPGTKLVDIRYDLVGTTPTFTVSLRISEDDGRTFTVPANGLSGAFGAGVTAGRDKRMTWNAGLDWNGNYSNKMRFEVTAADTPGVSRGWALIPASSFGMGDVFNEGRRDEQPVHDVLIGAFRISTQEVSHGEWIAVRDWALGQGYSFTNPGQGKEPNHPVQTVSWHDVVKWCNARSEMDGLTPCYRLNGTTYRSGEGSPECDWRASGYRLPTEAEWEKAARGGLTGRRFPSGNIINHSAANYKNGKLPYESPQGAGYHPIYAKGDFPFTSPVGSFPANAIGLHDMAGNVWEWCWDWYSPAYYATSTGLSNPRGPATGTLRVIRGGGWVNPGDHQRVACRYANSPASKFGYVGFRLVRRP